MSSENVVCSSEIKLAFNTSTFQIVFYSSCIFLLVLFYIFCSCSWHLHSGCVVIVISLYPSVLEVFPSFGGLSLGDVSSMFRVLAPCWNVVTSLKSILPQNMRNYLLYMHGHMEIKNPVIIISYIHHFITVFSLLQAKLAINSNLGQ